MRYGRRGDIRHGIRFYAQTSPSNKVVEFFIDGMHTRDARRKLRRHQPTFAQIFIFGPKLRELDDQAFARDRWLSFANEWISFFNETASKEILSRKSMKLQHRELWIFMVARLDFG